MPKAWPNKGLQAEALLVLHSPFFFMQHAQIMALVAKSRLPTMFGVAESARTGGLMAYDVDHVDTWRRVADYVDKILKAPSRPTCRWSNPRNSSWSSTARRRKHSGSCSPRRSLSWRKR